MSGDVAFSQDAGDLVLVYVTVPAGPFGGELARALVKEKLVACANLSSVVTSYYEWQGIFEESAEQILFLKARVSELDALTVRIKELHPYECPAIVGVPFIGGDAGYLRWLREQTDRTSE